MFCVKCGNQLNNVYAFCPKCGNRKSEEKIKVETETKILPKSKSFGSLAIVGVGFALGFLTIVVVIGAMGGGSSNTEYVYIEPEPYYQDSYYYDDYYYDEPYYDDYYYDGGY
jgi:uncharacterized membrane protein YvbJ